MRAVIVLVLLASGAVLACQFDTDCDVGSTCLKRDGQLYGSCTGGLNPGNDNDRKPVRYTPDTSRKKGNTCQFDTDCGPDGSCVKSDGALKGVCM